MEMRLLLSLLLAGLVSTVAALSAQGSKLLVVLEDESEKSRYSQFWTDLEGAHFPSSLRCKDDLTDEMML